MGTWSASLYGDDEAQDLQEQYRELATFGHNPPDILSYLLKENPNYSDQGDPANSVFWLVMADILVKKKCLDDSTRRCALRIIDSGTDVEEWRNRNALEGTVKQRQKVLEKLRSKILASEYKEPKPSKIFIEQTDLQLGDLCTYKHPSGFYAVLKVVGFFSKFSSHSPVFQILEWHQDYPPSADTAQSLPLRDEMFKTHPSYSSSSCTFESYVKNRYELLVKTKSIPTDMSFDTYFEYQQYKYFPVIRESERSTAYNRLQPLGVKSQTESIMIEADIPTNAWLTWKNFNDALTNNYWQYHKMMIDELGIINEAFN